MSINTDPKSDICLVMKGGGIKGIAYVGALEELIKYYNFTWYAGTSAGSISAILLAAGYKTEELRDILVHKNFSDFKDASFIKSIWNLVSKKGLYTARTFTKWMDALLAEKLDFPVDVRLEDLPNRATIFASTRGSKGLIFDSNDPKTKEERAAFTARCSMSIPIYFTPEKKGGLSVVDGGVQNNYPIEILKTIDPNVNFIGLYLGPETFEGYSTKDNIILDLFSIWTESVDLVALRKYKDETIIIDTRPISTTDFKLSFKEKDFLLECGRLSALKYLFKKNIIKELPSDYQERKLNNEYLRKQLAKKRLKKIRLKWSLVLVVFLSFVWFFYQKNSLNLDKDDKKITNEVVTQNVNSPNLDSLKLQNNKIEDSNELNESIIHTETNVEESISNHPINDYQTFDNIEFKQQIDNTDLGKITLDMPRRLVEQVLGLPHNTSNRCDNCFYYNYDKILINISYEDGNLYDFIMIRKNKEVDWVIPSYKKYKKLEQSIWHYGGSVIPKDLKFGNFTIRDILYKFKYLDDPEKQNSWNKIYRNYSKPIVTYYTNGNTGGTFRAFGYSELYERFQGHTYDIVYTFGISDHRLYFEVFDESNTHIPIKGEILHKRILENHKALHSPVNYIVMSKFPLRSEYGKLRSEENGLIEFSTTYNYFHGWYFDATDKFL